MKDIILHSFDDDRDDSISDSSGQHWEARRINKLDPSVIENMLTADKKKGYSEGSKHTIRQVINQFNNHLAENHLVFCEQTVREFISQYDEPNSYTKVKNAIKQVTLNQPEVVGNLDLILRLEHFFKTIPMKEKSRNVLDHKFLTYDEVQQLIKFGRNPDNVPPKKRRCERIRDNERMSWMISALFQTASRITGFLNIRLKDCEVTSQNVAVQIKKDKKCKARTVYMTEKTFVNIFKIFNPTDLLFLNNRRKPIHRSNFAKQLDEYALAAGIEKNVHPHIFRHSYAMWKIYGKNPAESIKKNIDSRDVQKVSNYLGHKSVHTTYKYYVDGQFANEEALDGWED